MSRLHLPPPDVGTAERDADASWDVSPGLLADAVAAHRPEAAVGAVGPDDTALAARVPHLALLHDRIFATGPCLPSGGDMPPADQDRVIDIIRETWTA